MPPRRATPSPGRSRSAVDSGGGALFIREQREAERYTERWHRVARWAERATFIEGFDELPLERGRGRGNARVGGFAATAVNNLKDAEEAFERGVPLDTFGNLVGGPRRDLGGTRRVVITAFTWKADEENEIGYDPGWITLGWGMTAHEAGAAMHRFIKEYGARQRGPMPTYQLIVTAIEVKFWTQSEAADDV